MTAADIAEKPTRLAIGEASLNEADHIVRPDTVGMEPHQRNEQAEGLKPRIGERAREPHAQRPLNGPANPAARFYLARCIAAFGEKDDMEFGRRELISLDAVAARSSPLHGEQSTSAMITSGETARIGLRRPMSRSGRIGLLLISNVAQETAKGSG